MSEYRERIFEVNRLWAYVRFWGGLLLVFSVNAAPFLLAWLVFGAPWWIAYFILVPQVFAVELYRDFCWKRGWIE